MTDEELEAFIATAIDELKAKQDELAETHGLGTYARFWFDQEQASLDFSDEASVTRLRAHVVPIGSWSARGGTWRWAWSNDSILPALRAQSAPLRELSAITGFPVFESEACAADESMAWELTAMAVRHLGAIGAYRVPGERSHLFLAMTEIHPVTQGGLAS